MIGPFFVLATIVLVSGRALAQSATVKLPVFDQYIPHPQPVVGDTQTFGWAMALGNLVIPS
jgi:hypothetical protein